MKLLVFCVLQCHLLVAFGQATRASHIYVPAVVQAAIPVQATITVSFNPLSNATYAYAFRVYLASSPYPQMPLDYYQTHCYLIHEQSLCDPTIRYDKTSSFITFDNTQFNVTIPADVGPSGRNYVFAARVMNTDGSHYTSQVFSDIFELTGANGRWEKFQKDGLTLWGDDGMSCAGWSCVQNCAAIAGIFAHRKNYYNCINACPHVAVHVSLSHGGVAGGPLVVPPACPRASVATLNGGPPKAYALPPHEEPLATFTGAAVSWRHSNIFASLCVPLIVTVFFR